MHEPYNYLFGLSNGQIQERNDYDFSLDPTNPSSQQTGWWKVENFQRNYIAEALKFFDHDDDVLISDLDEIPLKSSIDLALFHLAPNNPLIGFRQDMFYYNFKQKQESNCYGTVLSKAKIAIENSPQWIRVHRWEHQIPHVIVGGYHLSFWGTPEMIQNKIINAPHQENNTPKIRDIDNIRKNIIMGVDVYEREANKLIPVDRNTIDPEFLSVFAKYELNI